jgi:transcriptional regulator with XRE-family HTH domain
MAEREPAPELNSGELIRDARSKEKLSLEALGEKIELSTSFLSDVERGRRPLPFRHWRALFDALKSLDDVRASLAFLRSGPVKLDARTMKPTDQKALAKILAKYTRSEP